MGITWGLIGLQDVNEEIVEILTKKNNGENWGLSAAFTTIKLLLSLALIFEPMEKFNFHIVLLGCEILIVTLRGKDIAKYAKELKLNFYKKAQ